MAISAKIIGQALIERALVNAFEQWANEDVNDKHWKYQFQDRLWTYPNVTTRKNTDVVGPGPRDIYDLGNLYESGVNSFRLESSPNGAVASWHWDAKNSSGEEYAWYVHEGEGTNIAARKFTDDISIEASFFLKTPGMNLLGRVKQHLKTLRQR